MIAWLLAGAGCVSMGIIATGLVLNRKPRRQEDGPGAGEGPPFH